MREPTRRPHKRPDYTERREEIYRVSVEVFSEFGYVAGTTGEIARRAGLTQPALYHYVGAKHGFLVLICERVGGRFWEGMSEALALPGTARDRLSCFLTRHIESICNDVPAFQVYVTESRHLPSRERAAVREQEREYVNALASLIDESQRDGTYPRDLPPWLLSRFLLGAANWTFNWYHGQLTIEELTENVLRFSGVPGVIPFAVARNAPTKTGQATTA